MYCAHIYTACVRIFFTRLGWYQHFLQLHLNFEQHLQDHMSVDYLPIHFEAECQLGVSNFLKRHFLTPHWKHDTCQLVSRLPSSYLHLENQEPQEWMIIDPSPWPLEWWILWTSGSGAHQGPKRQSSHPGRGLNVSCLTSKAQQRMYFVQQLRKFTMSKAIMAHFYSAIIGFIVCLLHHPNSWYAAAYHNHCWYPAVVMY